MCAQFWMLGGRLIYPAQINAFIDHDNCISCVLRAGYAGESAPRCAVQWNINESTFQRDESDARNRNNILLFLKGIFMNILQIRPKDCRVLVVEGFCVSRQLRNLLASVLLKDLQVIAVSFQPDLAMAALASGHRNGIILDIGSTDCKAIAYADGCVMLHTLTVFPCGVATAREVFRRRVNTITSKNLAPEVSQLLFHKVAGFSEEEVIQLPSSGLANRVIDRGDNTSHELTAPTAVPNEFISSSLNSISRGESAYDGEIYLDDIGGAAGVLLLCIKKCPVDVRRFLASRIVTCGGGANICGLADRIVADAVQLTDSMSLFPEHAALAPLAGDLRNVSLYFKPSDMSWVGGSMFAADKTLNQKSFVSLASVFPADSPVITLPDWQSIGSKDWRFFSPLPSSYAT